MPATHVPKFPVVDPEPDMMKAIGNFNMNDITHVIGFTFSGYVVGWFGGKNWLLFYAEK